MMEYEATIPSRYMLGSTLGTVLCCSRKSKENGDIVLNRYRAHHGPIRALQRNPLFPKNFLTAGDWSLKIWSEDISGSPLQWIWSGEIEVLKINFDIFSRTTQSNFSSLESSQTFSYLCHKRRWFSNGIFYNTATIF